MVNNIISNVSFNGINSSVNKARRYSFIMTEHDANVVNTYGGKIRPSHY